MSRIPPAALILAGTVGVAPLVAQDLSESILTATISQSFEVDDNLDLDEDSPARATSATPASPSTCCRRRRPSASPWASTPACGRSGRPRRTSSSPSPRRPPPAPASARTGRAARERRPALPPAAEDFLDDITFDEVVDDEVPSSCPTTSAGASATPPSGATTAPSGSTSPPTARAPTAWASRPPGPTTTTRPTTSTSAPSCAATSAGPCGSTRCSRAWCAPAMRYEDVEDAATPTSVDADITVGLNYDVSNDFGSAPASATPSARSARPSSTACAASPRTMPASSPTPASPTRSTT
jgi:hypothetical protein